MKKISQSKTYRKNKAKVASGRDQRIFIGRLGLILEAAVLILYHDSVTEGKDAEEEAHVLVTLIHLRQQAVILPAKRRLR